MSISFKDSMLIGKKQDPRSYLSGVTNGTRQGGIFSPRGGFNTYLDPMLDALRKSGFGCTIGSHFYGALAYADDVLILATSVQGLQKMVSLCEKHAVENNLLFSTDKDPSKSKTMCISFNCTTKEQLSSIVLDNNILPWVTKAKHIGNYLHEDGTTGYDLSVKRGIFIQTELEINQEFAYLPASIRVRLNNLYNSHFSGSCIWRFESVEADRLIGSWNKNTKLMYNLPWATHRWILEEITGSNLKIMLYSRFIKFVNAIAKSNKPAIKFLLATVCDDVRSITGSNLRSIQRHTGIQVRIGVTKSTALKKIRLNNVPADQKWKVPLILSILAIQDEEWEIDFDENDDYISKAILKDICTS